MTDEPLVLAGRYEVGKVIGRGGMADVRRAHDARLGRDVAVKQLRVDLAGDPTFQARFKREAQSAAGLNHPCIVSVYDTGTRVDERTGVEIPYIVMELVEGQTLRDVLREGQPILPERAFEITAGVLDALAYSHKAGIIHRDIKPANVMLTKSGAVKVMDFGIARAVADTQATMTQTAAVIGTAQYLSPEQARGETVDARSDVYSAGCLLYELLTGRPPFVGDSPVSVAYQHVREVPVAPSKVGEGHPDITPEMDAIVLTSLAKDPADRYQSAGQMRDDIDRLLAHHPVAAEIPTAFVSGPAPAPADATMVLGPGVAAADTQGTNLLHPATAGSLGSAAEPVRAERVPAGTRTAAVEKKRTSPGLAALITILVLALLAGLGFLGYRWVVAHREPAPAPKVVVPAVVGYSESAARSTLQNAKLKPVVTYVDDSNATSEAVTAENPNAGTAVPENSEVALTVTRIPNKLKIPSVKSKTEKEARAALVNAGFKDANITTQDSPSDTPDYAKGQVTDVTPGEGSSGNADTKIVLTLSTGKVTVPSVSGMVPAEAEKLLNQKGFNVVVETVSSNDHENGKVFDQDPNAGSKVDKGATVTLRVAVKPTPTPTSSVGTGIPTATGTPAPGPTTRQS